MTTAQIEALINANIAGQGSAIDTSGKLAPILKAILANIPAESVFVATYGTTAYAAVKTAYEAGQIAVVLNGDRLYIGGTGSVDSSASPTVNYRSFFTIYGRTVSGAYKYMIREARVDESNAWSRGAEKTLVIGDTNVLVQAITAAATQTDVPSAKAVWDLVGSATPSYMTETTYSALKALRDAGNLVPGMFYRITDYVATVNSSASVSVKTERGSSNSYSVTSGSHPFDVVVLALATNKLADDAYAALHSGDTYFANSDLAAWRLKYSLDNDSKYDWADTTNGKGVIYRLTDEFGNSLGCDFKGLLVDGHPYIGNDSNLDGSLDGNYFHDIVFEDNNTGNTDSIEVHLPGANISHVGLWCYNIHVGNGGGLSVDYAQQAYNIVIECGGSAWVRYSGAKLHDCHVGVGAAVVSYFRGECANIEAGVYSQVKVDVATDGLLVMPRCYIEFSDNSGASIKNVQVMCTGSMGYSGLRTVALNNGVLQNTVLNVFSDVTIDPTQTNANYPTFIAPNSSNVMKIFNPADLVTT